MGFKVVHDTLAVISMAFGIGAGYVGLRRAPLPLTKPSLTATRTQRRRQFADFGDRRGVEQQCQVASDPTADHGVDAARFRIDRAGAAARRRA